MIATFLEIFIVIEIMVKGRLVCPWVIIMAQKVTNGLNVHDVFNLKASYDFKIGKHISIIYFWVLLMGGASLAGPTLILPIFCK